MKIAFISPYSLLKTTFRTNYQLMLPQLVENEEYAATYQYHCQNPTQFVILDNGAAEGVDFDWETLINIAYQYDVSEIVIPDTLGNKDETIDKAQRFKDFFLTEHGTAYTNFLWDFRWMFVVQGSDLDEVIESGLWAASQDWITTIGIPRHILTSLERPMNNARSRVANELTKMGSDKEIHFLGANPSHPTEVMTLANSGSTNQAYVRGMDTSMPYNYAFRSALVENARRDVGRPEDYFNRPMWEFDTEKLEANLTFFETTAGQ